MGIPGILREIGKGQRIALAKLAVEHLEKTQRPLRIAIDAAIWSFQHQAGQGGKNPALRTMFFRLLRLLALPIHPVFVYDGKNKPLTKRGRTVSRYATSLDEMSKQILQKFQFPHHTAPGEAEAECAFLQRHGLVDAVMSQDVDAIMFGSTLTLRDWSKEGTRGNKSPTHVNVLDSPGIKAVSGLDPAGMILVALLSGGDYDEAGVPGFGSALSCEIARAGFGADLLELVRKDDKAGLEEWRQRLLYELETNESGYFKKRHKTLKLPDDFPNPMILSYYTTPAVSQTADLPALEVLWTEVWDSEIDVLALRDYTARTLDWTWKSGARRFVRCFAQPLFQNRLRRGVMNSTFDKDSISERRQHFINGGIPELRLSVVPADVVGIDINAEDDNPEFAAEDEESDDAILLYAEAAVTGEGDDRVTNRPSSPSKKSRSPWDPYAAEKWWIPETLLQLGLPALYEDWHQLQRDIQADPKKFATRKAKSRRNARQIDPSMKAGAIRAIFSHVGKPIQKNVSVEPETSKTSTTAAQSSKPPVIEILDDSHSESESCIESRKLSETGAAPDDPFKKNGLIFEEQTRLAAPSKRSRPVSFVATFGQFDITPGAKTAVSTSTLPDHPGQIPAVEDSDIGFIDNMASIQSSQATIGDSDTYQLPPPRPQVSNITPRSPRRSRRRKGLLSDASSEEQSIKSFFPPRELIKPISTICPPTLSQTTLTTNPPAKNVASRRPAMPRESLPGAWKEADVDHTTKRSAPRVSYIDLTLD